jgi:hypothetical protein
MNPPQSLNLPAEIKEVTGDLEIGYWRPQSIAEWAEVQKTSAYLSAWSQQQEQERSLRKMIGIWVFILISVQVVLVIALVGLDAREWLKLNASIVKVLIPSVFAEVFGMGFVVVKYLFRPSNVNPLEAKKRK